MSKKNQKLSPQPTPEKKPALSQTQRRLNAEWDKLVKGEFIEYPKVKPL